MEEKTAAQQLREKLHTRVTIAGTEEYLIKESQNLEVAKAIECFYRSAELGREVNVRELEA